MTRIFKTISFGAAALVLSCDCETIAPVGQGMVGSSTSTIGDTTALSWSETANVPTSSGGMASDVSGGATTDTTSGLSETGETDGSTTDGMAGTSTGTSSGSSTDPFPPCPDGTILCDGQTKQVCDGMGGFEDPENCAGVCIAGLGCKACAPGATSCDKDTVVQCNANGDGKAPVEVCDGLKGLSCAPALGACTGACTPDKLERNNMGCDFYPTVTQQVSPFNMGPDHEFAIAVVNASAQSVQVTVTKGADPAVAKVTVDEETATVIKLPWVEALSDGNGASMVVPEGAYRVRSTGPVTVYQFNPIAPTDSNDASLLLPVHTWTKRYMVASWYQGADLEEGGFYAVTASEDGTTVNLVPSKSEQKIKPGAGVGADGKGSIMLDEGDVLQVVAGKSDVTGTIVEADRPVQVISGHRCAFVPAGIEACSHLEESMVPIETLANEFFVVPPLQQSGLIERGHVVRIIASADDTTLSIEPKWGNKTLVKAGDFIELDKSHYTFQVKASKKVLVAQYTVGHDGGYGLGEPAMQLAVGKQQWRQSYLIFAPPSWLDNTVDLVVASGVVVTIDDAPVAVDAWTKIEGTEYSVAHVKLSDPAKGNYRITAADLEVGVSVRGMQNAGSYWYSGGLNLDLLK